MEDPRYLSQFSGFRRRGKTASGGFPERLVLVVLLAVPVFVAWHLVVFWSGSSARSAQKNPFAGPALSRIRNENIHQVVALYAAYDYHWPPRRIVPAIALRQLPEGLAELPTHQKKTTFLRTLLPIVMSADERILEQRHFLIQSFIHPRKGPQGHDQRLLEGEIEVDYGVSGSLANPKVRARLLRRVDVVPVILALAQAAMESGWGTSRFAVQGNDLFGIWTSNPFVGMVPRALGQNPTHYVRAFSSLASSVRYYLKAINTRPPFRRFRWLRAEMRQSKIPLNPARLALGLNLYSQRGMSYVRNILALMPTLGRNGHLAHLTLVAPDVIADMIMENEKPGLQPRTPVPLTRLVMIGTSHPAS